MKFETDLDELLETRAEVRRLRALVARLRSRLRFEMMSRNLIEAAKPISAVADKSKH